jgi:hypothetical protein
MSSRIIKREDLQRIFRYARTTFFPRWDRFGAWRCQIADPRRSIDGLCLPEKRVIHIRRGVEHPLGVVIHEMCHAVCPKVSHGRPWQKRMLKAAQRAKEINDIPLADFLLNDANLFGNSPAVTAQAVYSDIQDAIYGESKIPSFGKAIAVISRKLGLTQKELLHRFRRCRTVYDDALREREQMRNVRRA